MRNSEPSYFSSPAILFGWVKILPLFLLFLTASQLLASDPETILASHGKRNARLHDPSTIVKCKDEYWIFSTGFGIQSWRSKDLLEWKQGPRIFPQGKIPAWITNLVDGQRGHLWAPDVIHHRNKYLLYYSISKFGVNTSAIALMSNSTLDPEDAAYKWTDHGIVIQSTRTNNFNAIDPALMAPSKDELWMSFGSFWSGLKLLQLDPATGKRLSNAALHSIAHAPAIEAPFIYKHKEYYYLFMNWGACCRGTNSTYNIRFGRSKTITGPYLDKKGVDLNKSGGTLLLATDGPLIGPGHAGIFKEGTNEWFSSHFYDATRRGQSMLSIRPLHWDKDDWPLLPSIPK